MQLELLVTDECPACTRATTVWRAVCNESGTVLVTVNVDGPDGRARLEALGLGTVPALLIDGRLVAVGVQSEQQARVLINAAADRRRCKPEV